MWNQEAFLTAPDGATDHSFGGSVSMWGESLAVGARQAGVGPGAVYVFTRAATIWTPGLAIGAPNPVTDDGFGNSVSLWNNTLAVGAYKKTSSSVATGMVFVFTRRWAFW